MVKPNYRFEKRQKELAKKKKKEEKRLRKARVEDSHLNEVEFTSESDDKAVPNSDI